MSITTKSDLDYNKRWDNSLEYVSISIRRMEPKLMEKYTTTWASPASRMSYVTRVSQNEAPQEELATHIRKNHIQYDIYRVDNA